MILVFVVVMIVADLMIGAKDLSRLEDWLLLVVPHAPLIVLLVGPVPGAVSWVVVAALILCLGGQPYLLAQFLFPTAFVLTFVVFLLRLPWAVVFAATVFLTLPISYQVNSGLGTSVPIEVGVFLAAIAAGVGLRFFAARVVRREREIAALREQQTTIRHEERATLAQELHDIVAHDVTVIAMQAQRARLLDDPRRAMTILESVGVHAHQALNDLHTMVALLQEDESPAVEDDGVHQIPVESGETTTGRGLVLDLENVVTALRSSDFTVEASFSEHLDQIPASIRQALRRTIRELATNILKHGDPGGTVHALLEVTHDNVTVRFSNAFAAKKAPAFPSARNGLKAMQVRCEVFGGRLETGARGGRWESMMSLPLDGVAQTPKAEVPHGSRSPRR